MTANSAGADRREVYIDREVGEVVADLMRRCITDDVLNAASQREMTGHAQTGVSPVALEYVEVAALLLEGYSEKKAWERAYETWHPGYDQDRDSSDSGRPWRGHIVRGEEYALEKAAEINKAACYRQDRRLFLTQDLRALSEQLEMSPNEIEKTINSGSSNPAKQRLLDAVPGSEEEVIEKIDRAKKADGDEETPST